MATATTGGANVALRFDIVADPKGFKSAVAEAQAGWKAATAEMQQSAGGVGDSFMSIASKAGQGLGTLAEQMQSALNGGAGGVEALAIRGFDSVKQAGEGMLDYLGSFGERYGGLLGKRVGEAVAQVAKSGIDPAAKAIASGLGAALDTDLAKNFTAEVDKLASSLGASELAASGMAAKVKEGIEGLKNAVEVIQGNRLAAGDFEAILEPLDKQIQRHERAKELIGKTAAEVAKLRAAWSALDAEANIDGMAADQTEKYQEKLTALQKAAGDEEGAQKAKAQLDTMKLISDQLDRQNDSAESRRREFGKSVGILAEERAILEASTRMKQRGRDLTEEETRLVRDKAVALGARVDIAARDNFQRQSLIAIERQIDAQRIEAETLGMSAGQSAAYRAEVQALARAKEQNITVTQAFRDQLHQEAAAAGAAVEATARMRESFQMLRDTGQIAMRGLEGVFDSFLEGRKISWRDAMASMANDLAKLMLRATVLQPLLGGGNSGSGLLGSLFSGIMGPGGGVGSWSTTTTSALAGGGPVSSGKPYLVGEEGPELFQPQSSGRIVPNGQFGGGGGSVINMGGLSIDARGATPDAVRALEARLPGLIMTTLGEARERGVRL